ncbi:MAG: class I SAM-dependent methyltransferase [Defluviitaleaceae bacterium]|nr:class I SAM-dependent methyltransferase [Defluviitaleaceae bacterium]
MTGWERERRTHFDEIVTKYDKVRWDYPAELFADIFAYADGKKAIEIGAGTGKATAPFLDAGYDVTAVEMGENMADFLEEKFAAYKNFAVVRSTFEAAQLERDSYDIIYAASAFHWVDAEIGCPKVFDSLKKDGVFALFRRNQGSLDDCELFEDIQAVYDKYYRSYYTSSERPVSKSIEEFQTPAGIYTGFRFHSMEQYGFRDVTSKFHRASQTYDAESYIALLDTYSDHRALPESNRKGLYAGVKEAIIKHGNSYTLHGIFQLYMGRK